MPQTSVGRSSVGPPGLREGYRSTYGKLSLRQRLAHAIVTYTALNTAFNIDKATVLERTGGRNNVFHRSIVLKMWLRLQTRFVASRGREKGLGFNHVVPRLHPAYTIARPIN